jgi:Ca-activated chloride channel family protein
MGKHPLKHPIRIEEFINYFTFDYAEPIGDENVSINSEIASCPWAHDHYLIRLGMKGKSIPENELPNSNYVFLIDVSGSMNSPEKLGILKSGFKLMADNLKANDRVAIVTYAGEAGVLLPSTSGDNKSVIKEAIDKLGAGGATAGADGIITAYEIAEENYIESGNNRVILGSDGDFNVGPSSVDELIELIKEKRNTGIYLTTLGVGSGNLNDHMMEQIANNGNGNYEYIDNASQLQKVFVYEKSKFFTVATDSKIQVTFNSNMVDSYRLIGYENRSLNEEDFENDSTDAGEIGASQTITAVYEVILAKNDGSEKFLDFDFRYKKRGGSDSQLLSSELKAIAGNINSASDNIRFAASVVGFGLLLKNSEYKGEVSKQMVLDLANGAILFDPHGYRKEFTEIVETWTQ